MSAEDLLSRTRKHLWAAWALSSEEIGSQAAATLLGLGMLVPEGGAAELERLRARVAEQGAELERVRAERDRYRSAWHNARTRAADGWGDAEFSETSRARWRAATLKAEAEVASLRAERHTTNQALSDADVALRANRDRIAELEQRLDAVLDLCDREQRNAMRWENPIPVPEWVAPVQRIALGDDKREDEGAAR